MFTIRIINISTDDFSGGAEKIASTLFRILREKGHDARLLVGYKNTVDPEIIAIPRFFHYGLWDAICEKIDRKMHLLVGKHPYAKYLHQGIEWIAYPVHLHQRAKGHEDFEYPGTNQVLALSPQRPEIIHTHNLHGGYFDLRALPWLSHQAPTVLTLHDAWLLSGHCAHSFTCERWKTGCGNCPDLSIYPAILRDATAYNWQRKAEIYKNSRLYIVTPSQWLMDKVNQSMLKTGIIAQKVIPNGVDQSVFHPADQHVARNSLNLPHSVKILLFTANGIRKNIWKDYHSLQSTLTQISATGIPVLCIALGEKAHSEHIGNVEIRFVPYQRDPHIVARYFQAADIYVHPARAEVWGLTITEALSCGIPIVASDVGGIPEQIHEGKTGFLVPVGNAAEMAEKILLLMKNEELRQQMGQQAIKDAVQRFGLERMTADYLALYQRIINT